MQIVTVYYKRSILLKNISSKINHLLYFLLKVKNPPGTAFTIWKNTVVLSASLWFWFHPLIWFNGRKWHLHYLKSFARLYLIYSLSNATNRQRWKLKENLNCFLYDHKVSQIHLFNNCKWSLNRYEWRHDSVLKTLMNNLVIIASEGFRFYADCTTWLFRSSKSQDPNAGKYWPRPDVAIQERNKTAIIELTCPSETNLGNFRGYKKTRYKNLRTAVLNPRAHFNLILKGISSTRFTGEPKVFE